MWLFYAIGSAFFAGVTSILAKCGIRRTDSTVATAVRTIVILVFPWIMVFVAGSAFFASLTAILGKIGITGVESNLGTAIRTCERGGAG